MKRLKIGSIVCVSERPNWTPEEQHDTWEVIASRVNRVDPSLRVYKLRSTTGGTICLTPNNDPPRRGWVGEAYLVENKFLSAVRTAALSTKKPKNQGDLQPNEYRKTDTIAAQD